MIRQSPEATRAIANLEGNTDWERFVGFLGECAGDGLDSFVYSDSKKEMLRLQGGCRVLDSLIEFIHEAPDIARKKKR